MNLFVISTILTLGNLLASASYAYQEKDFSVQSSDQINLHLKHYQTKKANQFNRKHAVLFIQGQSDATSIAEHFLLDILENLNLNVVSYDVRGQGLSGGRRGHVDDFYDHLDDLTKVVKFAREQLQYEHFHFVTHSTGSLIASLFASLQKSMLSELSTLTMIAPYFGLPDPPHVSFGIDLITYSLSFTPVRYWQVPKPGISSYLKEDGSMNSFTSDQEMYRSYKDHPDKCGRPTFGWVQASLEAHRIIEEEASKLNLPVLMFTATEDQVVSTPEARKFYDFWEHTSKHNRYIEFANPSQHGLIYEREKIRKTILASLGEFIDGVSTSSPNIRHNSDSNMYIADISGSDTRLNDAKKSKNDILAPKISRKKSTAQSVFYPAFLFFIPFATFIYFRRRRY